MTTRTVANGGDALRVVADPRRGVVLVEKWSRFTARDPLTRTAFQLEVRAEAVAQLVRALRAAALELATAPAAAATVAPSALAWERRERPGMEPGLEAGPWRLKAVPQGWLLYRREASDAPLWGLVRVRPFADPSEASAFIAGLPGDVQTCALALKAAEGAR